MEITDWKYLALVITTNKTAGTQLAMLAATFPDDENAEAETFSRATQLSPLAWAIEMKCTQTLVDVLEALMSNASIDDPRLTFLQERGLTASLWGQAKQIIKADWKVLWQEDGTKSYDPNWLPTFITEQGYEVVENV